MRKKAIDEWALGYWLLQQYAKLCFRIYYRKIELVNFNKIPAGQPVILAPNHQNALMDAMTLVCNTSFQNVFLARADIFKGKRMIRFLTNINIMPIYRIRDGIENVKRNDEVFEKTTQVLLNKRNPLILFAEGSHGDRRRLRQLVKGLFRIALQAQEQFGSKDAVKIIPVGIDYGHYQNFRTTLLVNVGDPIEISSYYNEYEDNPASAINRLKDTYAGALGKLMIDIQNETYYELFMQLRVIFNDEMKKELGIKEHSLLAAFSADKAMIKALDRELAVQPDRIEKLDKLVSAYQNDLKKSGMRDWVLNPEKNKPAIFRFFLSTLIHIIFLPVFLFGFVNNCLPYWFTASKARNVKDPQFHSSFKYVIGMIIFPVWYLILAGMFAFLYLPVWFILLYVFLLPFTGVAAFMYFISFKKLYAGIRYSLTGKLAKMRELRNKRIEIIRIMHEIMKRNHITYENPE